MTKKKKRGRPPGSTKKKSTTRKSISKKSSPKPTPVTTPDLSASPTPSVENPEGDLSAVLDQSKAALENSEQIKPTRGRGRPKKEESSQPSNPAPVGVGGENSAIQNGPSAFRPMLKSIFGFFTNYLMVVSNWEGWKLTPEESEMLLEQGDACAIDFIPAAQSKWWKLVTFGVSITAVFANKYFGFIAWAKEIALKKKTDQNKTDNTQPTQDGEDNQESMGGFSV